MTVIGNPVMQTTMPVSHPDQDARGGDLGDQLADRGATSGSPARFAAEPGR